MAIEARLFIQADEATDRDSLELAAKVIRHLAARLRLDLTSDVAMEYAGPEGERRVFGHSMGMTRGRTLEAEGALWCQMGTLHLDDPNIQFAAWGSDP